MFIQTILLRCLEIMQCHICLYNIPGEKRVRRNVGEATTNSRDPGKIVEGSQISLNKLISDIHGLKTFENMLLSKYRVYNV